jgi:hypothetical protein
MTESYFGMPTRTFYGQLHKASVAFARITNLKGFPIWPV